METQSNKVTTYIFDMDGTILDLHFDRQVWNLRLPEKISQELSISLKSASALIKDMLSPQKNTLNWYSLEFWNKEFSINMSEIEDEMAHLIKPRCGAIECLRDMQHKGRMILASNADPKSMSRKLSLTGIGHYFNTIISAHEIGFCKEELGFWEKLQTQLNFFPENTILIDDNLTVLKTAKNFGIAHLYGIRYPSSQGASITSSEFQLLNNFNELNY